MNADQENSITTELEQLRQLLPEPFEMRSKLDDFFNHPAVQQLIAGGEETIRRLISFLKQRPDPSLVRVAVLLLTRFPVVKFWDELLAILREADKPATHAFEPGIWLVQLPENKIAHDLVQLVASSGNPNPLLLLQRPAAKEVRPELAAFVAERKMPLSAYALYAYGYALEPSDIPFLKEVAEWVDTPELSALAGLDLLKLGSKEGLAGIRAGLLSGNEELRTMTYYQLGQYLPKAAIAEAAYDPSKSAESLLEAVETLMSQVRVGQ